jgi:hypothetical protein
VAVEAAIVHEEHLPGVPNAHGLAIVLNRYFESFDLADHTNWDTFMNAFTYIGSEMGIAIPAISTGEYLGYLDWVEDSVYFSYTPQSTGLCVISLEALLIDYYTDFDLYLYDAYGTAILSSTTSTSSETIAPSLVAGNTYYIEVYSYPGDTDGIGVFQLTIQQGTTIPPPPPFWFVLVAVGGVAFIVIPLVIIIVLVRRRSTISPPPAREYLRPRPAPQSQQPQVMRFCAYCGAVLPGQAQYCPVCGSSV